MRCMKRVLFACGALAAILSSGAALGDEAFERALSLATEKRYSEAREALDPLLRREPGDPRARLLHGVLRVREERVGEAIDIFEALRRDFPDMSEPYNNLAVLYAREGRLDAARELLLATLERGPDAVAYANLGGVYTRLARRAYERARELEAGGGAGPEPEMDTAVAIPATPGHTTVTGARGGVTESRQFVTEPGDAATEPAMDPRDAAPESPDSLAAPIVAAGAVAPATESRDATAETVSAASRPASPPATFCARAGGFPGRRAVAEAALWLQSYGAEVLEVRHEERRTASGYQVYLPPLDDREEAVAKLRAIRDRGVRDVAIIEEGELANGISFGVYREVDNVHRRVAALGQLGYAVNSLPAGVEVATEYVIEARAGGAPDTLGAAWASQFPGRALRVVDCG